RVQGRRSPPGLRLPALARGRRARRPPRGGRRHGRAPLLAGDSRPAGAPARIRGRQRCLPLPVRRRRARRRAARERRPRPQGGQPRRHRVLRDHKSTAGGAAPRPPPRDRRARLRCTPMPQAASPRFLIPAIVALAFVFLRDGGGVALLCLGAASMGLTLVHPSYTPFVAMLLLGFLLARLVLVRTWEPLLTRTTIVLGAVTAPLVLFLVLFYPVIRSSSSVTPSTSLRDHELANYGSFVTKLGPWFGMSPEAIARAGPVVVAGLIAIPLAAFAARRLW